MRPSLPVATAVVVSLALRLWLLHFWPTNIGLDGFQRWAGRDWLLVQGWLPATQLVVWSVAKLGGTLWMVRVALAAIASLAVGAGAALAERFAGRGGAWAYVVAGTYGPYLLWSTGVYQEGTFLLFLFAGLALAMGGRPRLGDVVIGAMGLVRYEGWPLVALYVLWRRDPRALVAGWGALVWLVGRWALGWAGHQASPVDYFDDWKGIADRFAVAEWWDDLLWFSTMAWRSGGYVYAALAVVGTAIGWRRPGVRLVALMALVQVGVVMLWIVGLERATWRMLVIPVMLLAVPAAIAVEAGYRRMSSRATRLLFWTGLAASIHFGADDAWNVAKGEFRWTRPEREALKQMQDCEGCRWYVMPRTHIGPRDRHDGCELLQGVSSLRHGEDFFCSAWPDGARREDECDGVVRWDGGAYTVTLRTAR